MVVVVPPEASSLEQPIQSTADVCTFSLSVWVLDHVITQQHRPFLSLFNPAGIDNTLFKSRLGRDTKGRGELD